MPVGRWGKSLLCREGSPLNYLGSRRNTKDGSQPTACPAAPAAPKGFTTGGKTEDVNSEINEHIVKCKNFFLSLCK
jgi:hypothetical protein